jgi:hypothetical protein
LLATGPPPSFPAGRRGRPRPLFQVSSVDLMLIATIVIWALNITVTKYVLTHGFRPLAYGSIRYAAAAVLAAGVAIGLERSLAVGGRRSLGLIAAASLFLLGNQFSFVYSLKLG